MWGSGEWGAKVMSSWGVTRLKENQLKELLYDWFNFVFWKESVSCWWDWVVQSNCQDMCVHGGRSITAGSQPRIYSLSFSGFARYHVIDVSLRLKAVVIKRDSWRCSQYGTGQECVQAHLLTLLSQIWSNLGPLKAVNNPSSNNTNSRVSLWGKLDKIFTRSVSTFKPVIGTILIFFSLVVPPCVSWQPMERTCSRYISSLGGCNQGEWADS